MEFWGVEVKPGETLKVKPELFKIIHISQAALGEYKKAKGNATVPLRLKINDKSFVMGLLSTEDRPQMMVDLVFEKEFELSHDWKSGSVYFAGYTADDISTSSGYSDDEEISSDEDGEMADGFPVKGEPQIEDANLDDDESDDSDAEEDSTDMSSSDEEPLPEDNALENSSSDDEASKKKQSKKRPSESAVLPNVTKKAKLPAPQKTVAKNGQAGKGPSPKDKSKGKNVKAPVQKRKA